MMAGGMSVIRGLASLIRWSGGGRSLSCLLALGGVLVSLCCLGCQESPRTANDAATGESVNVVSGIGGSGTSSMTLAKPDDEPTAPVTSTGVSGRKLWLGIQAEPAPQVLLDQFELTCGLVVRQVVPGGPSEGLLQVSDLITQFNGRDLACQKLLCNMIAEVGAHVTQLTVIRKAQQLRVDVLPQPIEVLGDGQIVQYTVLADPDPTDVVDVPVDGDQVVEKFRLFVVQPILAMGQGYDSQKLGADPGQLQLERVVKFGTNEQGRPMMTVQESGRTLFYTADDIEKACPEVQQLWQRLENQP